MPTALPVHAVFVDPFYMDVYEVTKQQYADGLNWALGQGLIYVSDDLVYGGGGSTPYCWIPGQSHITWDGVTFGITPGKEDHPMLYVSWYGAAAYANWRSAQEGLDLCYDVYTWECDFDAYGYRLPTEAEWEYAARGGEHDPYYRYPWGDTIEGSNANYWLSGDPYEDGPWPETTPVGYYDGNQMPPGSDMANGYGLYDMAGNLREWCNDWYSDTYYGSSPYDNPQGPATGTDRVLRNGSWVSPEGKLCCAYRYSIGPSDMINGAGFRLVLEEVCPTVTEIIDETGDGAGNTLGAPFGVAVDSGGNAYVTGGHTNNAFKITPAGEIKKIIFVLGADESVQATDRRGGRVGGVSLAEAVEVAGKRYLGTFVLRASRDARGVFQVKLRGGDGTFLGDAGGGRVAFKPGPAVVISLESPQGLVCSPQRGE